ncbi:type-F conjugative transfer system pilin assembly protein TrbC [Rubrivivax albus]|uniref:Type-F conjugative transfer system pilin assembly protein TrbC n=1 Tax=Rubrivivax albus TaxID=2499835 RepID=A0A3S2WQ88_9BURK|nr:type-F conjugative transfer system pilin assembly protein TrbC [Rubrivivax albus]RVT47988.1 type-F conjugative transfer system pilin assembly protein TrbC [Rubrivivax albus]
MWATDAASPIGRTLGAGIAALVLAGSVLGAPATPPTVTDADIQRARQQHRMPTDAELARVQTPAAPRIENLPQPVTRMPIDLEAISKGFDLQNGTQAAALGPGKAGPKVLIFVSFAMPEPTLQRLVDQAARAGATLVLRGLVNGSIRDTVTRMQALIGSRRVAVQIDPEAFDRYAITRTPTFVLVMDGAGAEACASRVCGSSQQSVKVAGDVTLDYAMQYLSRSSQGSARPRR